MSTPPAEGSLTRAAATDPLLAFPETLPARLDKALVAIGLGFVCVGGADAAARAAPPEGWAGAVVSTAGHFAEAMALCRVLRGGDEPLTPLLLVVGLEQLGELDLHGELFDDFLLAEAPDEEAEARLERWFARPSGGASGRAIISYGPLALNLETYQAVVAGRPLDLTFMEYELLRFLAAHPGKVFTREALLSRVWGYEYFGGARTVDVHVRRLRAKLGEEHANLIETVRSVGYRFGRARWTP